MIAIIPIPAFADNYIWLMRQGTTAVVVDPGDAAPVLAYLAREGLTLTAILATHHHNDHVGGNRELKALYDAQIVGPGKDSGRIPGIDTGVDEHSGWEFAGHEVRILEVPGHTRGAITFVIEGHAFTGDTLFALGCGRMFEGDAPMMWNSLSKLARLPDATKIYCGHEYTESNGRFALTIEPGNTALKTRMTDVKAARAKGRPTIPSTIGLEKQTNPFLRPESAEIRKNLGLENASDTAVFGEIRRRKDNF